MNEPDVMKILIPVDGSAVGDSILVALLPLMRARKIETTLLQAADSQAGGEEAQRRLEGHRKSLEGHGAATRVQIVRGRPAEEILRFSQSGAFDLIAMGTHGRMGIQRVLLGSVAEEVVRSSSIPVLLCRSNSRIGNWERVVVALDGTPGSEEILGDAARLARSLGATIHLLRVGLSLLTADGYRGLGYKYPATDTRTYLSGIADRLKAEGISAIPETREGMPGTEIALLAGELDAGLICMTTEGRPERVPGLDRSVAAEVMRSAPCPVYVRHISGAPSAPRSETGKKTAGAKK